MTENVVGLGFSSQDYTLPFVIILERLFSPRKCSWEGAAVKEPKSDEGKNEF